MCLDADLFNADWTKTSWDFPADMTTDDIREMIQGLFQMSVEDFKKLPVYIMNKDKIPALKDL